MSHFKNAFLTTCAFLLTANAGARCIDPKGILRDGEIAFKTEPATSIGNRLECERTSRELKMPLGDALMDCPVGTHLPTIRELAEDAEKFGAAGILKTKDGAVVDPSLVEAGQQSLSTPEDRQSMVQSIDAIGLDGKPSRFYFDRTGYHQKNVDFEHWFWSTSTYAEAATSNYYVISGVSGTIGIDHRDYQFAARCFENPGPTAK